VTTAVFRRRGDVPAMLLQPARLSGLLRAAAADWLVIVACWGVLAFGGAWLAPFAVLVIAGRLHALGVVLHDACHMRRSGDGAGWRLLELLAGWPITTTLVAMRYHHLRHHRHSGTARDPYLKPGASHRWGPALWGRLRGLLLPPVWIVRTYVGTLALFVPGLRNVYARFLGERSREDLRQQPELLACLRAEPPQAIFFLLLLPVALLEPRAFLVGYFLPLCLAGLCNANRVISEHVHVVVQGRGADRTVAHTVTHAGGAFDRLLLYPRSIGFHTVHHLHPMASMECLPALHAWYLRHDALYRPPLPG
jgi:fatty acid desaturase